MTRSSLVAVGHTWIKAPRSLMAKYVCARCGRDSMVKLVGKCSRD